MITKLELKNFKCFEKLVLDFHPLNVLMGLNGMGKSTVLQSLLLIRQSYKLNQLAALKLNGEYVSLGNGKDILYEKSDDDVISLALQEDHQSRKMTFEYIPDADLLPLKRAEGSPLSQMDSPLVDRRFSYLSAGRIIPRKLYRIADRNQLSEREFGSDGELTIHSLYENGNKEVKNKRAVKNDSEDDTLAAQVRQWLSLISPGIIPCIYVNPDLRNAELRYAFREGTEKTNEYKSINVGFGITNVLPVVINLLSADPGDILLLENPEAHIHPAGQRWLGNLVARVAAGGVQVVMETHSDHIINGIRLAVKDGIIEPDDTGIFYFYKDQEDHFKHKMQSPQIDRYGRIDIWPEGFMDEWDAELMELL